jgi:hypothetical protein
MSVSDDFIYGSKRFHSASEVSSLILLQVYLAAIYEQKNILILRFLHCALM